jgi:peptidoglycan LD-endopeptidase CwlK
MRTMEEAKEILGLTGKSPKYSYGRTSAKRLADCRTEIAMVAELALYYRDFSVVTGHRDEATQNRMVAEKKSKAVWPKSKHNVYPSKAIDLVPYNGGLCYDHKECAYAAGVVQMLFNVVLGHDCARNGADWDRDYSMTDTNFIDSTHFELMID